MYGSIRILIERRSRESVQFHARGISDFEKNQISARARPLRGRRARVIPMEFGREVGRGEEESQVPIEIEWMYIPIGIRSQSTANSNAYSRFILFLLLVGARARACDLVTYRSSSVGPSPALMRLFCAFQLIPLRERQVGGEGGGITRETDTIAGSRGVWRKRDHFAEVFSSCITQN